MYAFTLIVSFIFFQSQERLKGKYIMEYEEKYSAENCIIIFNDSFYKRRLPNGKTIKGKVEYTNFDIILRDKKTPSSSFVTYSGARLHRVPTYN